MSNESKAIYEKRNANEMNIVKVILWGFSMAVLFSYVPSILCWVMTITLGFPSSDYWAIPVDTDLM